jgi:hypothetical protein
MIIGTDWASWGTAVGTLVLALATFASVRSGNRAGRNAERALQAGQRPVLFASRPHETLQKVRWGDGHWAALPPGRAVLEEEDGVVYMAMSLQNVGTGTAVILGWRIGTGQLINPNATSEEMLAQPQMIRARSGEFPRPDPRSLLAPARSELLASGHTDPRRPRPGAGRSRACRERTPPHRSALWRPGGRPADDQPLLHRAIPWSGPRK